MIDTAQAEEWYNEKGVGSAVKHIVTENIQGRYTWFPYQMYCRLIFSVVVNSPCSCINLSNTALSTIPLQSKNLQNLRL